MVGMCPYRRVESVAVKPSPARILAGLKATFDGSLSKKELVGTCTFLAPAEAAGDPSFDPPYISGATSGC